VKEYFHQTFSNERMTLVDGAAHKG